MTELLEGRAAFLSNYTVTRKGAGQKTAQEDGIDIANLAPKFRNKIAEPYWVRYGQSTRLSFTTADCASLTPSGGAKRQPVR